MLSKLQKSLRSIIWEATRIAAIAFSFTCLVAVMSLFATCLRAQQTDISPHAACSLRDCISIAQRIQPAIRAQHAGVAAAVEQKNIAKSAYLPQIGFKAQYTNLDQSRTVDIEDVYTDGIVDVFSDAAAFFQISRQAGTDAALLALDNPNAQLFPNGPTFNSVKQTASAGIPRDVQVGLLGANSLSTQTQLVQPLWTGGKIDSRNVQAELGVRAAGLSVVKSQHEVAFNVTRAYLSVQLAHELEGAAADSVGRAKAIEKLVESFVDSGHDTISTADLFRVRSIRLLLEEQQVGFLRGQGRAYSALKLAMGLEQDNTITVASPELPTGKYHLDWNTIYDLAVARQPDLKRALIGERVAAQEVRAARAEYRPDVALFGSLTTVYDDENFSNPNNPEEWSTGITAQIPVYTGGRRHAQLRRAQHLQSQSDQVQKQVAQAVTQEARDAFLEYQEMGQRWDVAREAVSTTMETNESRQALYQGDLIDENDLPDHFKDVLTDYLLLLTSQIRYNQALFGYNLALARLKFVTVSDELPGGEWITGGTLDEKPADENSEKKELDDDTPTEDKSASAVYVHLSDRSNMLQPVFRR